MVFRGLFLEESPLLKHSQASAMFVEVLLPEQPPREQVPAKDVESAAERRGKVRCAIEGLYHLFTRKYGGCRFCVERARAARKNKCKNARVQPEDLRF